MEDDCDPLLDTRAFSCVSWMYSVNGGDIVAGRAGEVVVVEHAQGGMLYSLLLSSRTKALHTLSLLLRGVWAIYYKRIISCIFTIV